MSRTPRVRDLEHVVITGGAGAIGGAIAEALVAAGGRAHLSLVDRDADALTARVSSLGDAIASSHVADLADEDALPGLIDRLVEAHGPIDGLVNCAGVMELRSLASTPWDLGRRLLTVDLLAPLRLMALTVPAMVERRRGAVVNVSSMAGVTPLRGASFYGAAKAGLAMASEIAAVELARDGVHVVTVYPGPVSSGLEKRARAQVPDTLVARMLPTGDPHRLGTLVVEAMLGARRRVVYPPLYDLASRVPTLAGRVTRWLSPRPHA